MTQVFRIYAKRLGTWQLWDYYQETGRTLVLEFEDDETPDDLEEQVSQMVQETGGIYEIHTPNSMSRMAP